MNRYVIHRAALFTMACIMVAPCKAMEKESEEMKIRITMGDTVLSATLADSEASRDFISLLPLKLAMRDYAATEKVSDLPKRLSTAGAPAGFDPSIGDITYYAPWGNLAIFYRDFGYASGLVNLGRIDDEGVTQLAGMKGDFEAVVELIEP